MVKKGFTLIELIFTIVILALISVGSFKAIQMLYERYSQVHTITKFTILSQTLLDEISSILYYRVPLTAIGYNPSNGDFKKLADIDSDDYSIFEWISEANDAKLHIGFNINTGYSGFIDLDASDSNTLTLLTKDFNITDINDTLNSVFNNNQDLNQTVAVIFAGDLDTGEESADYNNSFGWHGYQHKKIFLIDQFIQSNHDAKLVMNDDIKGNRIFAKYYLSASAWAVARGIDIDKNAPCIQNLKDSITDNTLLLFYNYRPWKNQTFCADPHQNKTEIKSGDVAILANNITSFRVQAINSHIELKVQFAKPLYRGNEKNITITKQKVTF